MSKTMWILITAVLLLLILNVFWCGGDGNGTPGTKGTPGTMRNVTVDSVRVTGVVDTTIKVIRKLGQGKVKKDSIDYKALSDELKLHISISDSVSGSDSVVISYDLEYPERLLSRTDTVKVMVKDSSIVVIEEMWYEDGWFLGGIAALIMSMILLFIN